jgi:hypothetical protein
MAKKNPWQVVTINGVKEVQLFEMRFTLKDLVSAAKQEFPGHGLETLQITTTTNRGENAGHPVYHLRVLE